MSVAVSVVKFRPDSRSAGNRVARRSRPWRICVALAVLSFAVHAANAGDVYWTNGGTASFNTPGYWSNGAVPVNGNNNADVNNGGTITMSSTDTSAFTPWDIRLGEDQSGTNSTVDSGYFVQTGGSVTVSGWLRLGVEGPTSGMYTLSAGTLNCLLNVQDGELGSGTIGMSGGVYQSVKATPSILAAATAVMAAAFLFYPVAS